MVKFAISLLLVGLLVFYPLHTLDIPYLANLYSIWDKAVLLAVWVVLYRRSKKHEERSIKWVCVLLSMREAWEIISAFTGWNINNKKWCGAMFMLIVIYCITVLISESKRWNTKHF